MGGDTFLGFLSFLGLYTSPIVVLNTPSTSPSPDAATVNLAALSTQTMDFLISSYSNDDGRSIDYFQMLEDDDYTFNMQRLYDSIEVQDPGTLSEAERKAFFINLYNILTIDSIVQLDELPESTQSITDFWRSFAYKVAGNNFTLDRIEHGILRGNKPHPDGTVFIEDSDTLSSMILPFDKRIHAALNCGARSCPILNSYSSSVLDNQLEGGMKELCKDGVELEKTNSKITVKINTIFKWFAEDFGSNESEVLKFLANCTNTDEKKTALLDANDGKNSYYYSYNWDLNLAKTARTSKIESGFENNASL